MRKHVVLIDYENVKPRTVEPLVREGFHVRLFVGPNQSSVPFELADSMQKLGDRAAYIKSSKTANNALDFHIAYYLGALSAKDQQGHFSIVARDKGYEPLIVHLKSKGMSVDRVNSIREIPGVAASLGKPPVSRSHTAAQKTAPPSATISASKSPMLNGHHAHNSGANGKSPP